MIKKKIRTNSCLKKKRFNDKERDLERDIIREASLNEQVWLKQP